MPSSRHVKAVRIDRELLEGMDQLQERDGVPHSEQIRRALRAWLEEKGIKVPKAKTKGGRTS